VLADACQSFASLRHEGHELCRPADATHGSDAAHDLDNVLGALADPTRRAIMARLSQDEAFVGELAQPFDMALPRPMKHMRVLATDGLETLVARPRGH
jgi:DNA-binding transcriptional ArsR family regulator